MLDTVHQKRHLEFCDIISKNWGGRGALFAAGVSLKKGGVERKLSLGLVRSFFALSIGDNIRYFSQSSLGSYHWLRTRRLLRLQKTNSSLAPLPLRFAAFSRCSLRRGRARCPTAPRRREDTPPYLMRGLADVTRRKCLNVICNGLPVGHASVRFLLLYACCRE